MTEAKEYFPDDLVVSPMFGDGWRKRKVLEPFRYVPSRYDMAVEVPAGFITDYASIPRIFWSWLPAWGPHGPAAIVHDYLYACGESLDVPLPGRPLVLGRCTRKRADKIFERGMKILGVSWPKRKIMYSAVRMFGGPHYNKEA